MHNLVPCGSHRLPLQDSALVMQVMDSAEVASNVARQGCGLGGNLDVAVCRAEWLFHQGACQARSCNSMGLSAVKTASRGFPVNMILQAIKMLPSQKQ